MKTYRSLEIEIPTQIPVFPLPNTILFPESEVPLYIYEPRYRKMLADCLKGSKFMAVSLLKPGWEKQGEAAPCHEIVGVGYLRAVIDNPDGTSHVLLKGVGRAKIIKYQQLKPYRIAKVRVLPERIEDASELKRLFPRLKRLFLQKVRWESDNPGIVPKLPKEMNNPVALSYLASFMVRINPYLKQDLLETVSCNYRVKHIIDLLEEELHSYGTQN